MAALHRLLCRRRGLITSIPPQLFSDTSPKPINFLNYLLHPSFAANRRLSTNAESATEPNLGGLNAYEILGVPQSSSFKEIKASFRKLAKETHPDLAHSHQSSDASKKFIQIVAAYEILSDCNRRAHYDSHLRSRTTFTERHSKRDPIFYNYNLHETPVKQMEVVEWLKWYRDTINDIVSERRLTGGSGYFDILERDFYFSVHVAYYGPEIESADLLPACFEADERSTNATPQVLQLVYGRDLFGLICIAGRYHELCNTNPQEITSSTSEMVHSDDKKNRQFKFHAAGDNGSQKHLASTDCQSDAYRDLELHVAGRIIATARRFPPKNDNGMEDEDSGDHIYVYLASDDDSLQAGQVYPRDKFADSSVGYRIPLGVIRGLGAVADEGTCYVYNNMGVQTHAIMKHRTLLVLPIYLALFPANNEII